LTSIQIFQDENAPGRLLKFLFKVPVRPDADQGREGIGLKVSIARLGFPFGDSVTPPLVGNDARKRWADFRLHAVRKDNTS